MESVQQKKEFLKIIYQISVPDARIYNVLNFATLILGIRNAILFAGIKDDLDQPLAVIQERGFLAKVYPVGKSILVLRSDAPEEYKDLFDRIVPYDLLKSNLRNMKNIYTGRLLGYLQPIPLSQAQSYPVAVQLKTRFVDTESPVTVRFFPQRVSRLTPEFRERLEVMKRRIEEEVPSILPDTIRLESIEIVTEGAPGVGGRRRKTRKHARRISRSRRT